MLPIIKNEMKENYILVESVKESDLETALMNLANLYVDTVFVNGIQLYRKKGNLDSFLILFSNQPDFERFNYFVNYIKYPEDLESFKPFIRGYYRTDQINKHSELKDGEWIMVYISKNDKEFDNVNLVNEVNQTFKYEFSDGKKIKKQTTLEVEFELKSIDINEYQHIIDIIPSKIAEKIELKPWWKFW